MTYGIMSSLVPIVGLEGLFKCCRQKVQPVTFQVSLSGCLCLPYVWDTYERNSKIFLLAWYRREGINLYCILKGECCVCGVYLRADLRSWWMSGLNYFLHSGCTTVLDDMLRRAVFFKHTGPLTMGPWAWLSLWSSRPPIHHSHPIYHFTPLCAQAQHTVQHRAASTLEIYNIFLLFY